jgi:hypothetical protein
MVWFNDLMPDPINPIAALNPFSRAVVQLTMYFKDPDSAVSERQKLATGTGFIREIGDRCFLITARHNLTGRRPETGKPISRMGGIPNEIELDGFHIQTSLPLYRSPNNPNYPDHCPTLFCEHTDSTIDVAVLPFMAPRSEWPMAWDESFFDETQNQRSVGLRVTQTCFVIGFPLGLVDLTTPAHVLPIYKTANIASEPHLDFQGRPIVIIDVTTRSGMSGSPVIVSQEYQGSLRNRFVGVYTGRFAAVDHIEDPSLGIVYKPKVIQEIFSAFQK